MAYLQAPPGCVSLFGGATAPYGWLLCDGSAVSRTTYAALFAVIGTTYGVGDGSTTFNLPSMAAKFPRGNTPGTGGGSSTLTHAGTAVANHTVTQPTAHGTHASTTIYYTTGFDAQTVVTAGTHTNNHAGTAVDAHGVTQPNDHTGVEPPYVAFAFIIKT